MNKLPQFSRLFSADLQKLCLATCLWFGLIALLGLNIDLALRTNTNTSSLAISAILSKDNRQAHLSLARIFFNNGNVTQTKYEIDQAKNIMGTVLGTASDNTYSIEAWQQKPLLLTKDYAFWKSVIDDKPDYRDAYIMASIQSYNLGKTGDALVLINQALTIDPNYAPAINLKKSIFAVK
jgi:tetratricopeptide (TPR) repeat protein